MGFSMRVERVGVESVKAKLEALKKAATATSHTGSHSSRTAGGTSGTQPQHIADVPVNTRVFLLLLPGVSLAGV